MEMIQQGQDKPYEPLTHGLIADRLEFSPSQRTIRRHGTPGWVLLVSASGKGTLRTPEGERPIEVGDIFLHQPRAPHDWGGDGQSDHWELLWAYFMPKPEWASWLRWPEISPGIHAINAREAENWTIILDAIRKTIRYYHSHERHNIQLGFNALEELILQCDMLNPLAEPDPIDSRVKKAMTFIIEHLGDDLRLKDIAEVCYLSVSRLRHLFLAHTGTSIQKFIEVRRIERARDRLSLTTEPVNQIAYSLGFKSPFYFSRRFKLHTGMSPREFRDHQQHEHRGDEEGARESSSEPVYEEALE